jgi:C-terminal processing protease CtpA/Prc
MKNRGNKVVFWGNIPLYFEIKGARKMEKDMNSANETVEANIKINEQLEDGKVHASTERSSEAETANLQMQDQFRGENEQPAESVSPAFIYNPSIKINPENEK